MSQPTKKSPRLLAFLLVCATPALAVAVYLTVFAKPAYETQVKLIVRENQGSSGAAIPGFASALLGVGSKTSLEDALILQDYLHSPAFIELAADAFDLRNHFANAPSDPFRRLEKDAPAETFYRFFRKMVFVEVVSESSIMTVYVRAFDPSVAQNLANFIVEQSEKTINELNQRMAASQTSLAQRELAKSMERLSEAKDRVLQFQIANAMVDPVGETAAHFSNVAALDSQLIEKKTRLRVETKYLQDDAFDIQRLRQEIRALEEQRREETRRLVTEGDSNIASTLQTYERLKLQEEFALAAYTTAFALAEQVTLEASRQEKFLLVIAPPHVPEKPVFPRPIRGTATALVLSCIAYGIVRLILATIRDHTI